MAEQVKLQPAKKNKKPNFYSTAKRLNTRLNLTMFGRLVVSRNKMINFNFFSDNMAVTELKIHKLEFEAKFEADD